MDAHEVVRMKDFRPDSWQRRNARDYGSRIDYWCCSTEIMASWFPAWCGAGILGATEKHVWNPDNERMVRAKGIKPQIDLSLFQRWNFVYECLTDKHRMCLGLHAVIKVCERGSVPVLMGMDNLLRPVLHYYKADNGSWEVQS